MQACSPFGSSQHCLILAVAMPALYSKEQVEAAKEHIGVSPPARIGVKGEGHQSELVARVSRASDESTLRLGHASPKSMDGFDNLSDELASPDTDVEAVTNLTLKGDHNGDVGACGEEPPETESSVDMASPATKNKRTLSDMYIATVGPPGSYFDVPILKANAKRAK